MSLMIWAILDLKLPLSVYIWLSEDRAFRKALTFPINLSLKFVLLLLRLSSTRVASLTACPSASITPSSYPFAGFCLCTLLSLNKLPKLDYGFRKGFDHISLPLMPNLFSG